MSKMSMSDFKALREARKFTSQGRSEELLGNVESAIQNYTSAIEKYPSMVEARVYWAFLEWTRAGCQEDLLKVERILNEAIDHFAKASSPQEIESGKVAVTKRMLLLCQEGREQEAESHLAAAGFEFRLSKNILSYAMFAGDSAEMNDQQSVPSVVAVRDDVLPSSMFEHLQSTFRRDGPFWSEHSYNTEQSGYFSYLHKLDGPPRTNLEQIIHHLWRAAMAGFPAASEARFAEWCAPPPRPSPHSPYAGGPTRAPHALPRPSPAPRPCPASRAAPSGCRDALGGCAGRMRWGLILMKRGTRSDAWAGA